MTLAWETLRNMPMYHFVPQKSQAECPGIETGSPHWKAGNLRLEDGTAIRG